MTGPLAPTTDRIWGPFRALVNLLIQPTRFYGTYEYTITGTDGSTVNGTPNDPSLNLPAINGAQLRADSIATQMPTVGNLCHIVFVDGNPAKFCCVWSAPSPESAAIVGGGSASARKGDEVTISVSQWNTAAPVAPSSGGAVTISSPMKATITSGSSKVTCG